MDDPQVVSPDEWLAARRELLAKEKEFTRQRDALNAERRKLPMVAIDKAHSTYQWLDLTARGRAEDWEQPPGRSDGPLLSWLRHHDRYDA